MKHNWIAEEDGALTLNNEGEFRIREVDGKFIAECKFFGSYERLYGVKSGEEIHENVESAAAIVDELIEHRIEQRVLGYKDHFFPNESGPQTPWGPAQHSTEYGDGIIKYGTAGHGGIKVPDELNQKIPSALRVKDGWYEEDCDWAIVAVSFPGYFTDRDHRGAVYVMERYYAEKFDILKDRFPVIPKTPQVEAEEAPAFSI